MTSAGGVAIITSSTLALIGMIFLSFDTLSSSIILTILVMGSYLTIVAFVLFRNRRGIFYAIIFHPLVILLFIIDSASEGDYVESSGVFTRSIQFLIQMMLLRLYNQLYGFDTPEIQTSNISITC